MVYAVIDTNILVSSRISKNPLAATVKVVANVFQNRIIFFPNITKFCIVLNSG